MKQKVMNQRHARELAIEILVDVFNNAEANGFQEFDDAGLKFLMRASAIRPIKESTP